MNELEKILTSRDGMTQDEIDDLIAEWRSDILDHGIDPEEILYDLGLEPDYVFDLLDLLASHI